MNLFFNNDKRNTANKHIIVIHKTFEGYLLRDNYLKLYIKFDSNSLFYRNLSKYVDPTIFKIVYREYV